MQYFSSISESDMPTRSDFELVSNSSYSDTVIKDAIKEKDHSKILFPIACQLSVNGWGKESFGIVKVAGIEFDIKEYFDEIGVLVGSSRESMEPETLTPRRIIRAFRYEIQSWLSKYPGETYLVRKYGGKTVRKHKSWMFPGAEHSMMDPDIAKSLLHCYNQLDKLKGTNFSERVHQVLVTRGIIEA